MDRQLLTTTLKKLEPALLDNGQMPVLGCYCFGEKSVHSYNAQLGLSRPYTEKFNPPFRGAVRGKLLLGFLNNCGGKDVEFETEGHEGSILFKCGRPRIEIPTLLPTDFLFEQPAMDKAREIIVSAALLDSLKLISSNMGSDPTHPWRMGVTMVSTESGDDFYATNNRTITRVTLGTPEGEAKSYLFPPRFVQLLLSLIKEDEPRRIHVAKSWVRASFKSGLKLFSKSIAEIKSKEYFGMVNPIMEREAKPVAIPAGLEQCLQRAMVVSRYATQPVTTLKCSKGKLKLITQSDAGLDDSVNFEQEEMEVKVPPELLLNGMKNASHMTIFEDCVRFTGKGYVHLVATAAKTITEE